MLAQTMLKAPPLLLLVLLLALAGSASHGQWREEYESAQTSWRLVDADCGARIAAHQRTFLEAHSGAGSEYWQIVAGRGTYLYLAQPIGPARVIAELSPSLWIKSDRAALQLLARVVLPRSVDPQSGEPLTTLLRGTSYDQVGSWQQLTLTKLDQALERQIRVLRSQFGPQVDAREAYVDKIVLNAYPGVGVVNVWIDDLEIAGHVPATAVGDSGGSQDAGPRQPAALVASRTAGGDLNSIQDRFANNSRGAEGTGSGPVPDSAEHVRLQGSVLLADDRPLLLRSIRHNGESFQWLKSLGFNAIQLDRTPDSDQLQEAERLQLWLVAPPPYLEKGQKLPAGYDRVAAWSLGRRLGERELEPTRQLASQVRLADPRSGRPLVGSPGERLWSYSQAADVLLLERSPLGSSFELAEYGPWLAERGRLARLGTPLWAAVQTEPDQRLAEQLAALDLTDSSHVTLQPEQIRLLTYQALAAGVRGICFQSHTPLQQDNLRAHVLQQLNLELALLEPWIAAGSHLEDLQLQDGQLRISVLQTERARLLIVLRQTPQGQHVVAPSGRQTVSFVLHGAPITDQAYRIGSGGLQPLRQRRGNGTRITLEDAGAVSLVVLTQDPLVVNHLARHLATHQSTLARLRQQIAVRWLELVEQVDGQLAAARPVSAAKSRLQQARANLEQGERLLHAGDYSGAEGFAERGLDLTSALCRAHWEQAARAFSTPVTSPCCTHFTSLPLHWALAAHLRDSARGPNVLPAGDFENLEHLVRTGWSQYRHRSEGLETAVELSPESPRSGRFALRLGAWAAQPDRAPQVVETPPVAITSAPVSLPAGQMVRIHGWAKVPQPLDGSRDGLLVFDSLGGPSLADRIRQTAGWQEFTLYRVVPQKGPLTITFALTGLGEAWIDDVSVSLLQPSGPPRLPEPRNARNTRKRNP